MLIKSTFDLLSLVNIVPLDEKIAEEAGKIYSDLIDEGKEIELNDCLIAATSLSLNIKDIITRDIGHFNRIESLVKLSPEDWLEQ